MNICITRGGQAFTIPKSQVLRLLPAAAVQSFALKNSQGAALDCTPVLAEGQPGIVIEPSRYFAHADLNAAVDQNQNVADPVADPTMYAVVSQDGDTLLLLAADQISF
jgi:hypothetical protein